MDQPIFVHANSVNLPSIQKVEPIPSHPEGQESAKSPSVGAVVRPQRHSETGGISARSDSVTGEQVPTPHVRTNKLEDYVNWLRNHKATQQAAESDSKETTHDVIMPASDLRVSDFNNYVPKSSPGFSIEQLKRVDGAHQPVAAPVISASRFPIDPDLQKLDAVLESEEIDAPVTLKPQNSDDENDNIVLGPIEPSPISKLDADEIIRTVSQAIAAVLTEPSESEVANMIRQQLGRDAHKEALAALPPEEAQQIAEDIKKPKQISTPLASSPHFAGNELQDDFSQSGKKIEKTIREIPTTIAAWDVEDFRWPSLTNQMIVAGSQAIAQLENSTFQMLGTANRRLAVTSPGRGEGTTSVSISLARWAAASGRNVLLVDADLASPGLSVQVGLGPNISWVNAVSNSLDPAEVIIRSQKSPVCVMPMTPIVTRVAWPRFIFDSLGALTEKVQSNFDLIIFDVGPTSQLLAELSNSSLMIDAGLIVHNGVDNSSFLQAKERLQEFGISRYLVAQNSVQQAASNVA